MSFSIHNNNNRRNATTIPPMNARFLDSSDEESEDEETRLEREEAEQERLLSKQFGEAQESSLGMKRKSDQDDNLEAEYTSSAKPKKKRHVLTPAIMTSANGLFRVQTEFPRSIRWNVGNQDKVQAAAVYSRTLVNAYKSFCYDLFPSMAFSDVLTRMETFGSQKQVKEHLQHLRQDVCRAHLEQIYGNENAERIMMELQHGLQAQQGNDDDFGAFEPQPGYNEGHVQRGPPLVSGSGSDDGGTGNEEAAAVATTNTRDAITTEDTTNSLATTNATTTTPNTTSTTTAVPNNDLQDSDDELEFVISTKPIPVNPFADDDDSDEEEDKEERILVKTTKRAPADTSSSKHDKEVSSVRDATGEATKAATAATLDKDKDAEIMTEDDATVVMAFGFQTNTNQVTSPEAASESKSTNEKHSVKDTTTTTTLNGTLERADNVHDDVMEEKPQAHDNDDKVNVSPQESQDESPLSFSSNETATIVPTMSETYQLDTVATQANDTPCVAAATQDAVLAVDATDSTRDEEETPTQLETPTGEAKEEATRMES